MTSLATRLPRSETLTRLKVLDLRDNKLKAITGLETLVKLRRLGLHENDIQAIEGLENLTKLQAVNFNLNNIRDCSPLIANSKLNLLFLHDNPIDEEHVLETLKKIGKGDWVRVDPSLTTELNFKINERLSY